MKLFGGIIRRKIIGKLRYQYDTITEYNINITDLDETKEYRCSLKTCTR